MKNLNVGKWVSALALGAMVAAGASAQSVPLRPRDNANNQNRPPRPAPVTLTKDAQTALDNAVAAFKKLPVDQRMEAARQLQRQLFEGLTPEERAKVMPQFGPGGRGGGPGGPGAWGGRRGRRGQNGQGQPGGPPPPPPPGGNDQGAPPPPPPPPGQ